MIEPLFILAPPRSFTSISSAMIGCHPQLYGLAEVNVFAAETVPELFELYRTRPRLQHGLLRSLADIAFGEQTEATIESARQWLAENQDMSTAELFRTMQDWVGESGLVDKSPLHVFTPGALQRIGANFPAARYLHLTRHPGDTVKSVLQLKAEMKQKVLAKNPGLARLAREGVDADTPETMWLQPHLSIVEFLESVSPSRKMRLRGEDLLSDPRNYLTQIAEWLEIWTDDAAIEAMMHPENSPFAKLGPANGRYGNDPNFMEQPHLRPYSYTPRPLEWVKPDGEVVQFSETLTAYGQMFGY